MAVSTTLAIHVNVYLGREDNKVIYPLGSYYLTIPKANRSEYPLDPQTQIVTFGQPNSNYNSILSWMGDFNNIFSVGYYIYPQNPIPNNNAKLFFTNIDGYESPYAGITPHPNLSVLFENTDTGYIYSAQGWTSLEAVFASMQDWKDNNILAEENGRFCTISGNGSGSNYGDAFPFFYEDINPQTNLPTTLYTIRIMGLGSSLNNIYAWSIDTVNNAWYTNVFLRWCGQSFKPYDPDLDPYNPNSEHTGGDGEEQEVDSMNDETLPTISVADTGFVTLYKPSISQMNALASYMWGAFDIDTFKKVFANPMDVILGLSILPGIVPAGGSSSVMVGNVNTGISMTKVANQYVKFDCGSVTVKRKWGAFLDYSPYTKAFIYLPFIGIEPIDVDEIMNKTVSVTYNIDVLSGGCCAFIKVDGTTLYSYIGQCACSVPVTGKDWSTMINGVLGAVSGIAGTVGSLASGNVAGAVSGIASIAQNVTGAKPTYQRSGSMGGMGGMMGIKTPYILIERPVQAVPGYQNRIIGYPSFITRLIGSLRGYTEIEQCHLENIPCTGEEMIEIENILKTGVIL